MIASEKEKTLMRALGDLYEAAAHLSNRDALPAGAPPRHYSVSNDAMKRLRDTVGKVNDAAKAVFTWSSLGIDSYYYDPDTSYEDDGV